MSVPELLVAIIAPVIFLIAGGVAYVVASRRQNGVRPSK